jgi:hypothetical protein
LRGIEPANAHAYNRCIYIHGTPEERAIGRPASYGCIRMKSSDVAALYNQVPIGTLVQIVPDRLPKVSKAKAVARPSSADEGETTKDDWTTSARPPNKLAPPSKDAPPPIEVSGRGA